MRLPYFVQYSTAQTVFESNEIQLVSKARETACSQLRYVKRRDAENGPHKEDIAVKRRLTIDKDLGFSSRCVCVSRSKYCIKVIQEGRKQSGSLDLCSVEQ